MICAVINVGGYQIIVRIGRNFTALVCHALDVGIVRNNPNAVGGLSYVDFNCVEAVFCGFFDCRNGVLGRLTGKASVSNQVNFILICCFDIDARESNGTFGRVSFVQSNGI